MGVGDVAAGDEETGPAGDAVFDAEIDGRVGREKAVAADGGIGRRRGDVESLAIDAAVADDADGRAELAAVVTHGTLELVFVVVLEIAADVAGGIVETCEVVVVEAGGETQALGEGGEPVVERLADGELLAVYLADALVDPRGALEIEERRFEIEGGEFFGRIQKYELLHLDVFNVFDETTEADDAALRGVVFAVDLVIISGPRAERGVGAVGGADGETGVGAGGDGIVVETRARDNRAAETIFGLCLGPADTEEEVFAEAVVELEAREVALVLAGAARALAHVAGLVAGETLIDEAAARHVARAAVEAAAGDGCGAFVAHAAGVGEPVAEKCAAELNPWGGGALVDLVGLGGREAVGLGVAVLKPIGMRLVERVEATHTRARDGGEIVGGVAFGEDIDGGDLRSVVVGGGGEVVGADEGPEVGIVALHVAKKFVEVVAEADGERVLGD